MTCIVLGPFIIVRWSRADTNLGTIHPSGLIDGPTWESIRKHGRKEATSMAVEMGFGDGMTDFAIGGNVCESVCMSSKNIPAKPRNPGHGPQIYSFGPHLILNIIHRFHNSPTSLILRCY